MYPKLIRQSLKLLEGEKAAYNQKQINILKDNLEFQKNSLRDLDRKVFLRLHIGPKFYRLWVTDSCQDELYMRKYECMNSSVELR